MNECLPFIPFPLCRQSKYIKTAIGRTSTSHTVFAVAKLETFSAFVLGADQPPSLPPPPESSSTTACFLRDFNSFCLVSVCIATYTCVLKLYQVDSALYGTRTTRFLGVLFVYGSYFSHSGPTLSNLAIWNLATVRYKQANYPTLSHSARSLLNLARASKGVDVYQWPTNVNVHLTYFGGWKRARIGMAHQCGKRLLQNSVVQFRERSPFIR